MSGYDPTRTTTLRKEFQTQASKRFNRLKREIRQAIVEEDGFGLKTNRAEFEFETGAGKVAGFMQWLKKKSDDGILEVDRNVPVSKAARQTWASTYIKRAYAKGVGHAQQQIKKSRRPGSPEGEPFISTKDPFDRPIHADRAGIAYTRTYKNLKGVTDDMDEAISQELAEALAKGENPKKVAARLNKRVDISKRRAMMIARTETINAHADATLNSLEEAQVQGVEVIAEHLTARDGKVCPECKSLEGKRFTLEEARGQIPVHPNCRCAWAPAVNQEPSTDRPDRPKERKQGGPGPRPQPAPGSRPQPRPDRRPEVPRPEPDPAARLRSPEEIFGDQHEADIQKALERAFGSNPDPEIGDLISKFPSVGKIASEEGTGGYYEAMAGRIAVDPTKAGEAASAAERLNFARHIDSMAGAVQELDEGWLSAEAADEIAQEAGGLVQGTFTGGAVNFSQAQFERSIVRREGRKKDRGSEAGGSGGGEDGGKDFREIRRYRLFLEALEEAKAALVSGPPEDFIEAVDNLAFQIMRNGRLEFGDEIRVQQEMLAEAQHLLGMLDAVTGGKMGAGYGSEYHESTDLVGDSGVRLGMTREAFANYMAIRGSSEYSRESLLSVARAVMPETTSKFDSLTRQAAK